MLKFTIDRKIKVEVNMADINKNLKSICSFYASEWHLVTMLLPNLDQKINKGVKVTTILEKDLTKEMETLLTKLHLDDKKEIINIVLFGRETAKKTEFIIKSPSIDKRIWRRRHWECSNNYGSCPATCFIREEIFGPMNFLEHIK